MKKIQLILLLLLFVGGALNAQEFEASYTYDANGNRVSATVIYLTLKSATIDSAELDATELDVVEKELEQDTDEQLGPEEDYSVRIYPNPTQSDVLIEINGANPKGAAGVDNSIKIFSLSGKLMINVDPITSYNTVEMSHLMAGSYILLLKINGNVKSYKIIKN